jgi:transcriptional regulator with XRE-family HTH domain
MSAFDGLGKALRWLRARQDKRQYQVADESGVTKAMLSAYETGKQKPSLETLEKILDGLGANLDDLHRALRIVNGQSDPLRPTAREVREARPGSLGERDVDVRGLLGLSGPLPPEREEAFRQMLQGFHLFLRHLHQESARGSYGDDD